jgi:hypothetical protein
MRRPRPRHLCVSLATLACLIAVGAAPAAADVPFQSDWAPLFVPTAPVKLNGLAVVPSSPGEVFELNDFADVSHSADSGATWATSTSAICIPANDGSVVVDPADTSTMFMSCQADGMLRSDDGGATWRAVDFGDVQNPSPDIRTVAFAPSAPDTIYAVTESHANSTISTVYRSADGGQTWDATTVPGLDDATVAIDPADADRAIISGQPTTASGSLLITGDGGDTWTPEAGPWAAQLAFDPSDPSHVWAVAGTLEESTDYGATWTPITGGPSGLRSIAIAAGKIYVASGAGVARTSDDGATWTSTALTAFGKTQTVYGIAIDPADSNRLYVQTDPGPIWALQFSDNLPATEDYQLLKLDSPTNVTPTSVTLNGDIAPMFPGGSGNVTFRIGLDTGHMQPYTQAVTGTNANSVRHVSQTITGLLPDTTYQVALDGNLDLLVLSANTPSAGVSSFTTPPAVTPSISSAPVTTLRNGVVNNGHIPASVTWTAAAGTYPLATGHLDESLDGGAWAPRTPTGESSDTTTLAFGHGYHFRAQAVDSHGQVGVWRSGATGSLTLSDDAGSGPQWSANWSQHNDTSAVDGTIHRSSKGTASVTLRFSGTSVAVIAPRGPHFASFSATLDGQSAGVVTPSATTTTARHTIAIYSFAGGGGHTLVLHVSRSSGHTLAAVDGFAILH